ncbi:glycosyltransferase [Thiorhodococcus mannitoliphagus]|uniref:Glycosyltransferase n=1 Tax=Thiorhodococcus mannitoliphagus TaxID=329406 RepID=A0A6P1DN62_9GAMM|nr:glycosyltransferase family 2 protein [Thiorhodococcus mannitoliphagus]NEX19687.1 glycosyltransferase [Thiorhodococcus mannitoliphagus]
MSTTSDRVAVVLVTFNRKQMLIESLRGIFQQSVSVERIFLIDNDSTDGTQALLESKGYLSDARITYRRMPENTGGAGGFHEGLRLAQEAGFDWYWVLDDDVEPEPDCLEKLLGYRSISECVHPLVLYQDGTAHEWEHVFDPITTYQAGLHNLSFRNGKDWCVMQVACFEGMLVSASILAKVGLPETDFFVYGDDGLFGLKASFHTTVIYVQSARLSKKIKPGSAYSPFKIYYDLRNRFMMRRKLAQIIYVPRYTRYLFILFILLLTIAYLRTAFSPRTCQAAFFAWKDGLGGITGRKRY